MLLRKMGGRSDEEDVRGTRTRLLLLLLISLSSLSLSLSLSFLALTGLEDEAFGDDIGEELFEDPMEYDRLLGEQDDALRVGLA